MTQQSDRPLVTVLIPAFNHAQFVEESVLSVINQTYPNIQLVVIDDGSTDQTRAHLLRMQSLYGFTLHVQTNKGLAATLNDAIQNHVSGKYVCLLASDDFYEPRRIETLTYLINNSPDIGFVYSNYYFTNELSKTIGQSNYACREGNIFKECLAGTNHIHIVTCMFDTEKLKSCLPIPTGYAAEDMYLLLSMTSKYQVRFCSDSLAHYRKHALNTTKADKINLMHTSKAVLDAYRDTEGFRAIEQRFYLYQFFALSDTHRILATKMIPRVGVSNMLSRWFVGGVLNLIGLTLIVKSISKSAV